MRHLELITCILTAIALPSCLTSPDTEAESSAAASADDSAATPITPPDCPALAAELTELLAAAQSCNVAAANVFQCASRVPTIYGCERPVASAGSDATLEYLAVYKLYAQGCPLPDIACVDPSTQTVDCTQSSDIDSLVGQCTIVK